MKEKTGVNKQAVDGVGRNFVQKHQKNNQSMLRAAGVVSGKLQKI
jgi:hypothetical protein